MTLKQENLILSLIGTESDGLKPIEIHKLLFMLEKLDSSMNVYEFIPYKKGCYSPTLSHDLRKLESEGYIETVAVGEGDSVWRLTEKGRIKSYSARNTGRRMVQFRHLYPLRGKALVVDVYKRYPYWAINSIIFDLLLRDAPDAMKAIQEARPTKKVPLASIGYEGRSIEDYINSLIRSGISVLCDVRKNPISRRYGFSKSTLREICEGCGIEYRHYPQLGIASSDRRDLKCQLDYDLLFSRYEKEILSDAQKELEEISSIVKSGRGVALTCFEANPAQCHRTKVLNALRVISEVCPVLI